jgi:hypothetical protein
VTVSRANRVVSLSSKFPTMKKPIARSIPLTARTSVDAIWWSTKLVRRSSVAAVVGAAVVASAAVAAGTAAVVVVAVVDVVAVIVETGVAVATAEIAATAGKAIRSFSWRRASWPVFDPA